MTMLYIMEETKIPTKGKAIVTGIIIGILLKFFILDVLVVNGTSMEPTLKDGQKIVVNKLSYGLAQPFGNKLIFSWNRPKENEIVVFPYKGRLVVKRCVATENALLEYSSDSEYNLIIKDKKYPLTELQYKIMKDTGFVPEGTVLVIGDNYLTSIDSRTYGFVSRKNILGRIMVR